jgi:hypothetical protein
VGNSVTFVLRRNTTTNTAVTVTISGTSTTGQDTSNTASYTSGDSMAISIVVSSTGVPNDADAKFSLRLTAT